MPYISQRKRRRLDPLITALDMALIGASEGEVNYVISRLIDIHYYEGGYAGYNAALGVLEAVKQEYYRRVVAPYEDKKKLENGDVYL